MGEIAKVIRGRLEAVSKDLTAEVVRSSGRAMGALVLDLWRQRLKRGIGPDGKPYAAYSQSYAEYKRGFIAGRPKAKKGQRKGRKYPRKGEFAASDYPDFGALTGKLKRSGVVKSREGITGKESRQFVEAVVEVDLNSYGKKIVNHHLRGVGKKRVVRDYGPQLSKEGTSQRAKEDVELLRFLRQAMRRAANAKGIITQA